MTDAVFAIPGDKDRRTGGFIYEARVLRELNQLGCATAHLQLPDGFPEPSALDMDVAFEALGAIAPDRPIILDGLVFGALDPDRLAQVRAPVIAMIHHPLGLETGLSAERAAFLLQNEARALRHATHILVPSPETARILCADFGAEAARITIAAPGFDRPVVDRRPQTPAMILSVGLLAPRKGHDVLLDALARIVDLPWRAEIVGAIHDPDYARALLDQTRALDLGGRVSFAGELGARALTERFNAASIFALATRYEGYGMVLSEAMMFGLPIVSCAVGAVPATVGEAAALVPPDDPVSLSAVLQRLLTDPGEAGRLSEVSALRAVTLPHWRDTAAVVAQVVARFRSDGLGT